MDVRDYSQNLDRVKERYQQAEKDLKNTYEKNTDDLKKSNETKTKELSKNFENQKYKLEEQNDINNQNYTKKTQEELARRQSDFREDIKKNVDKFNEDRNDLKNKFNEKLTDISDSYDRSLKENDRVHQQATKVMSDRYNKSNNNYRDNFEKELSFIDKTNKDQFKAQKEEIRNERRKDIKDHLDELEDLRLRSSEERFSDVEKLKRENEKLRAGFEKDKLSLNEQQNARIDDLLTTKNNELAENQKKFSAFQEGLRQKVKHSDDKFAENQLTESKALERKFDNDVRSIKRMAEQKVLGGTEVSNLKEQNKQTTNSYENKLASTREEARKESERNAFREETLNNNFRQQAKDIEHSKDEAISKKEKDLNSFYQKQNQEEKDKSTALVEHYKSDSENTRAKSQEEHDSFKDKSSQRFVNQRVEFGKFINSLNEKKNEELNQIREDSTKDKTVFIEKAKHEFIDEKSKLKLDFSKQLALNESVHTLKLEQQEKETQKIIDNYENRLNQIARKAEQEVEAVKAAEEERKVKESTAFSLAFEAQNNDHHLEIDSIRNRYETAIARDRATNEKNLGNIIQKYEDQLEAERTRHSKELSIKVAEDQAQFQRLYRSSELEKATLRSQYEERIENLLTANQSNRSKKA